MGRTREISNSDDVLDSRNVIARIEELEAERKAIADERQELSEGDDVAGLSPEDVERLAELDQDLTDWDDDNGEELADLKAFAAEGEQYAADWKHGATLIRGTYFTEYCEDLCEDTWGLPKDLPGFIVIDWEATARNLKHDYTEIEWAGVAYLVR